MPRAIAIPLLVATLALLCVPAPTAAAGPICAGVSTSGTCYGVHLDTCLECPVEIGEIPEWYLCVGIYRPTHCTGVQLP